MGILALTADERVVTVVFADDTFFASLGDGRTITVPPGIPNFFVPPWNSEITGL
jgi:hypothetical protein